MAKPSITKRNTKGAALTYSELDTNFQNLKDATISVTAGSGGTSVSVDLNGNLTLVAGTNITLSGNNTTKEITITSTGSSQTPWSSDVDTYGYALTNSLGGDIKILENRVVIGDSSSTTIELQPAGSSHAGVAVLSSEGYSGAYITVDGYTNGNITINTKSGGGLQVSNNNFTTTAPVNGNLCWLKVISETTIGSTGTTVWYIPCYKA
jgi:hypothetical protein